jgi:hypothetical protein
MTVSGLAPIFLCASFGAVLAELWKWYQLRESPNLPSYTRQPRYWILTVLMVLAGGALATLYGTDPKPAILVAQIGLSTPLVVKTLAETKLGTAQKTSDEGGSLSVPGYGMNVDRLRSMGPSVVGFLAGR